MHNIIFSSEYSYTLYQFRPYRIDNLTLPMEITTNEEEQEKQRYVSVPETISDNVSLETIKILKMLSKETLQKSKNQNGIPIVSGYFQEIYIKLCRIMERFTKISRIIIIIELQLYYIIDIIL